MSPRLVSSRRTSGVICSVRPVAVVFACITGNPGSLASSYGPLVLCLVHRLSLLACQSCAWSICFLPVFCGFSLRHVMASCPRHSRFRKRTSSRFCSCLSFEACSSSPGILAASTILHAHFLPTSRGYRTQILSLRYTHPFSLGSLIAL